MRLAHRILSVLCLAALLLPSVSHAATASRTATKTVKLSDVLAISEKNKKSTSFEFRVEGTSGTTSIGVIVKGTQKGNPASLQELAGDMAFSVDLRLEDGSTAGAIGRLIVVDGTLYVTLESLDTTNPFLAIYADMFREHVGTWFSMPLDESDFAASTKNSKKNSKLLRSLDQYFTVKKQVTRDGTTYVVTVPRAKQRLLLKKFLGKTDLPSYASQFDSLRTGTIDFTLTLKTVRDLFDSLTTKISVTSRTRDQTDTTTVTGSAKTLGKAPVIKAPAKSVPFDELFGGDFGIVESDDGLLQIEDARNAQRRSDVNTINSAIYQYAIDHDGRLPMDIPEGTTLNICKSRTPCAGASLDALLEAYLVRIPTDPLQDDDALASGYTVFIDKRTYRITIAAPEAENDEEISFTR